MRNARAVGIQRGIFVANTNNPEMRQGEISRKSATVALYHHDQQYLSMDHVWCVEKRSTDMVSQSSGVGFGTLLLLDLYSNLPEIIHHTAWIRRQSCAIHSRHDYGDIGGSHDVAKYSIRHTIDWIRRCRLDRLFICFAIIRHEARH